GISTTYFNGIKVGLTTELKMKNNFSLLTGILYNLVYSDKVQGYPNSKQVNYLAYGHFLNLPVMGTYNLPLTRNLKVFAFAGPTLNYGLSQINSGVSTVGTISSFYTDLYKTSVLNRLDLQVGIGGGIQFKKYQLKAGYDYGLLNLNRSTTNMYQKGWYVSLSVNL
ncbi:MAG TPA: porin family protein, partial [Paludibacter sp.]